MSNIDDLVVGQSNQDFLSKMEEELNKVKEQEQEEEKKPLEERVKSKNWKTRKNAYTEIFNILKTAESRTDKIFLDYVNLYPLIIDDPHASAQETALDVIKILLENYEFASNLVPDLFKVMLEKCYTSSRAVLKSKAKEMLVLSLEVSIESSGVIEILKSGLESKNPKFQQASLNILSHLISLFGSFKIEYRSLITYVEKLSESTSPQMRSEVLDFYKELYKWIKDAIKPYVSRLKDSHQKDLEKAFDEIKGKNASPQVTKFLKCDKNLLQNDQGTKDEIKNKMLVLQEEENIFKNTEAVELFQGKFNEAWAEDIISKDRKWSEKKEMLDNFIQASNVMKINNSSKSHIIVSFQKLLKDNNINVVNSVIMAINNIAKGLRKDFMEAKEFLLPLLEKLKEKREKLVQDVFTCLDSLMTHCINMEEIIDELRSFISSQSNTIQSKERFCIFLEKVIMKTYICVLRKFGKQLADIMFRLTDDASPDVRNAALTTIGVIKYRIGDMPISKILNELCDIKKKKVDEASKNVTVDPIYDKDDSKEMKDINKKKNLVGNKNISNTCSTNSFNNKKSCSENILSTDNDIEMKDCSEADVVIMKKQIKNNNNIQPKNIPTQDSIINDIEMNPVVKTDFPEKIPQKINKLNVSSTSNNPNTKQTKPQIQQKQATTSTDIDLEANEDDSNMSNEDVELSIKEKIGTENINLFNDSKWENRKTAFTNLASYILDNVEECNRSVDILLRFIRIKLKDYKENNFNIVKEALLVVQNLCESCGNFAKKHCIIIIKKISEKIGDNKLKSNVLNLFVKFMEYHGPKYITNILLKHLTNNVKSPSVLKEFSIFLEKVIEDFGIGILPIKELVDYGKFLASNANPQLRNSATQLLCMIYKYIGPNIKKFLNDIKEATLKVIESEFEKIQVVSTNENMNKRELKGNAAIEAQSSNGNSNNLIENLFPRADISKKITQKIIKDLNEGKWQVKKEALENLEKIFTDANMRIMPNGLNELITCLKNKLDDGNKNMVRSFIQFISKLVEALGNNCKLFAKTLITPVLRNLSDKMNLLREDVIKCLEKWSEMIGFENVLIYCPAFLIIDNFELRTDLLKLVLKYKVALSKYDCKELIPGVLSCLLDKMPTIRNLAEELAKEILKIINISNFYNAMKDYKPAIATTIKGIIEKYSSLICMDNQSDEGINCPEVNTGSNNINTSTQQGHGQGLQQEFKFPNANERSVSANNQNKKNKQQQPQQNPNPNNPSNSNQSQSVNPNQKNNLKNKRGESNSSEDSKSKSKKPQIVEGKNYKNNNTTQMPNLKPINVNSLANPNPNTNIPNENSSTGLKLPSPLLISQSIRINQKNKRLEGEKFLVFPNEYITQAYDNLLRSMMTQFFNKQYVDSAFSNDVTKFNILFTIINQTLKSDAILFFEVTDLWLKWILIRNLEMNNNCFFNTMVFDFIKNLYDFLKENECLLHDLENKILLEIFVSKLFTINQQAKARARTFFLDFCKMRLIKLDKVIETLSDKFNLVYDMAMKNEMVEILSNVSKESSYLLDDPCNIKIIFIMYESICLSTGSKDKDKENPLKKILFELIREFYKKNENKKEMNIVLESRREFSEFLEVEKINFDNNQNIKNSLQLDNLNEVKINNLQNIKNLQIPQNPQMFQNLQNFKNNLSHQPSNAIINTENKISFSHSPLYSLQKARAMLKKDENQNPENSSKESLSIFDRINQNKIDSLICQVSSQDLNEKNKALIEFNDIFTNKYQESVIVLEKNIDKIILSFKDVIKFIFSPTMQPQQLNNISNAQIDCMKYLLTVFYKSALTKDVIENCELDTVYLTFEEILRGILFENLESQGEAEEGKKIIKSLNALILKLMENFKPTFTFISFIKLIQIYRSDNSRICSLSIKCLLKLSNIMSSLINSIEIEKILVAIYEFISDFEKDSPELNTTSQNEEMCIKILRTIIHEIIKLKNEGIWNYYRMAIETNKLSDKHLKRWIQLILRSKNGLSLPSLVLNSGVIPLASSQQGVNNSTNFQGNYQVQNTFTPGILNSNFLSNTDINTSPLRTISKQFEFQTNMGEITTGTGTGMISSYNELNFYIEKLNKNQGCDQNTHEKILYEVIAILKRSKLPIEFLKDKISCEDYSSAIKVNLTIVSNDGGSSSNFHSNSFNRMQDKENLNCQGVGVLPQQSNKFVSNFNVGAEKENVKLIFLIFL